MDGIDELERRHTLTTAVARVQELRLRDSLADPGDPAGGSPLGREESLELLGLQELVARKAGYGRQLVVRSARAAGASWTDIGRALGTSRQAAWEAHRRWIDDQEARAGRIGELGFDADEAAAARTLAGDADT